MFFVTFQSNLWLIVKVNEWLNMMASSVGFGALSVCLFLYYAWLFLLRWRYVYNCRHALWITYSSGEQQESVSLYLYLLGRLALRCWCWPHGISVYIGPITANLGQAIFVRACAQYSSSVPDIFYYARCMRWYKQILTGRAGGCSRF